MLTLLPELLSIARAADDAILNVYAKPINVTTKTDDSPVTAADLAAHHIISHGLQTLTPDIPVVSEEDSSSHAQRNEWSRYWLVDPLDGTKEFIQRNDEFTVNIALIDNHQPSFGLITAPALQQAYWGAVGHGAWQQTANNTPVAIQARQPPADQAIVLISRSHPSPHLQTWLTAQNNTQPALTQQRMGSSLKLCHMAAGQADVYPRFGPTAEWDIAAGQAILTAAGGQVFTMANPASEPLSYGHHAATLNPNFIAAGANPPSAWLRRP